MNERIDPIVKELCKDGLIHFTGEGLCKRQMPSRNKIIKLVEDFRAVLFPGFFGTSELNKESISYFVGATLDKAMRELHEEVRRGLCFIHNEDQAFCKNCEPEASRICAEFLKKIPEIKRLLITDSEAAFEGDPALRNKDEAIFCYPGIFAITCQRIAHELFKLEVPLIPRIITEYAHSMTGIDIHPGARIGEKFFIDHGTGVVIGETTIIGKNVRLYQGVTLGAKSFPLDENGKPIKGIDRHPIVEDNVVIYAGATILGRIKIGKNATVGGNVWVTHEVAEGAQVTQKGGF